MSTSSIRNAEAQRLRTSIEQLAAQLEGSKAALQRIVGSCQHEWGETVYDPEHIPGYHIPGDPPGFGGVDHQFAMDVPAKTNKRWRRTCKICGHSEVTSSTRPAGEQPVF